MQGAECKRMFKVLAFQPGDAIKFELPAGAVPAPGVPPQLHMRIIPAGRPGCNCHAEQARPAGAGCSERALSSAPFAARNPHASSILAAAQAAAVRREARLAANPKQPKGKQQSRKRKMAPSRAGDTHACCDCPPDPRGCHASPCFVCLYRDQPNVLARSH